MAIPLYLLEAKKLPRMRLDQLLQLSMVYKIKNSKMFCAVRPPGHHAEKDKAMGFVFITTYVGSYYLIEKYKLNRIAIIDFDVHHGNGTQEYFL